MGAESMHPDSMFDIEEELEIFTVRSGKTRTSEQPSTSRDYKSEADILPLVVKDIHQLVLPDRSFAETITAYGIPLATALIYGRISTTGAGANGRVKYCLDDGTGLIQVRLLKRKTLKDVNKLDLQCYRTFGTNKELYKSVKNLLKITRQQLLDFGSLPFGTKALLIGRPHRYTEQVVFSVFEMIIDEDATNDFEIAVKNFIVEWYDHRYKLRKLKDPPLR